MLRGQQLDVVVDGGGGGGGGAMAWAAEEMM